MFMRLRSCGFDLRPSMSGARPGTVRASGSAPGSVPPYDGGGVAEEVLHLALVAVRRVLVADRLRETEAACERLDGARVGVAVAEPGLLVARVVERPAVTQQLQRLRRQV